MIRCKKYDVVLKDGKLSVPRDEFFAALKHFVGGETLHGLYLEAEQKNDEVFMELASKTVAEYIDAMYKQGRAFAGEGNFAPRIFNPKGDGQ